MSEYERMQANFDRVAEKQRRTTVLESPEYADLKAENQALKSQVAALVAALEKIRNYRGIAAGGAQPVHSQTSIAYEALKDLQATAQAHDDAVRREERERIVEGMKGLYHDGIIYSMSTNLDDIRRAGWNSAISKAISEIQISALSEPNQEGDK